MKKTSIRVLIILLLFLVSPVYLYGYGEPYMMILVDTSASMLLDTNGNLTYGDGSLNYPGIDTNNDGLPNDSRLYIAKEVIREVVSGVGDIIFGLARYRSDETQYSCPIVCPWYGNNGIGGCWSNISCGNFYYNQVDAINYIGWETRDGNGICCKDIRNNRCTNCTGSDCVCYDFDNNGTCDHGVLVGRGADIIVPCRENNQDEILRWVDGIENWNLNPPNKELRATGLTPLARAMMDIRNYFVNVVGNSTPPCHRYAIILTDGYDTCEGTSQATVSSRIINAARRLYEAGVITYIIAFAINDNNVLAVLDQAAKAGQNNQTATAYRVNNRNELRRAFADIIEQAIQVEICNGIDDDCDGQIDEGVVRSCRTQCGSGIEICQNGVWGPCSAGYPTPEECDGIDNNCNGIIDEGLTNGGICGSNIGECRTGTLVCQGGNWICVGAREPSEERCNGLDDDCDNMIDENLTGGSCGIAGAPGSPCHIGEWICQNGRWICTGQYPEPESCDNIDNDCDGIVDMFTEPCTNECGIGVRECIQGEWSECTAPQPRPEECNNIDDDCDGDIDENLIQGECITQCGVGIERCINGIWICDVRNPNQEECNGIDDDCDGLIDNGIPWGNICGSNVGECEVGHEECINGEWICVGGRGPTQEICDGLDNDCDGETDEEAECPMGSICIEGQCAIECNPIEEFPCPIAKICTEIEGLGYYCLGDPCFEVECEQGKKCVNGQCVDLCYGVECPLGTRCKDGRCVPDNCYELGCNEGEICHQGRCIPDPCIGIECNEDEYCDWGECYKICVEGKCGEGLICIDGQCVEDKCYKVECEEGKSCNPQTGECSNNCFGVICSPGQVCDINTGRCIDDPCIGVRCPKGTSCKNGTCYESKKKPEKIVSSGGGIITCNINRSQFLNITPFYIIELILNTILS